jgi:hypothetical protein
MNHWHSLPHLASGKVALDDDCHEHAILYLIFDNHLYPHKMYNCVLTFSQLSLALKYSTSRNFYTYLNITIHVTQLHVIHIGG